MHFLAKSSSVGLWSMGNGGRWQFTSIAWIPYHLTQVCQACGATNSYPSLVSSRWHIHGHVSMPVDGESGQDSLCHPPQRAPLDFDPYPLHDDFCIDAWYLLIWCKFNNCNFNFSFCILITVFAHNMSPCASSIERDTCRTLRQRSLVESAIRKTRREGQLETQNPTRPGGTSSGHAVAMGYTLAGLL
jgi:hypothetical protein